ncbi:MAG: RluA family pseudouridine synthase [Anaerolineae bacterium]
MSDAQTLHLSVDRPAERLDQWLAVKLPHLSRSQLQKLIRQEQIRLNGQPTRPSAAVQPGDEITLHLPAPEAAAPQPETVALEIVYEDDDLVVINKPAGMVVHPAQGHSSGTVVNALLARYPDLANLATDDSAAGRPGIVHRLDQDTSGLMLVARTAAALRQLQQQFKQREVEKIYLALVYGQPAAPEGIIDVPLGRDPQHRQKFAPRPDGKPARTHYRLLESYGSYSLLEIGLETGRTHQIRVHLAWLKCPVVGDTVYGRKKNPLGLPRQFLHAWRLRFQHPRTGETMRLEAPPAEELQRVLNDLRLANQC